MGFLGQKQYNQGLAETGGSVPARPRTLTEQLNDRLAYHRNEIKKIEEAINALSPDVERALNALSKL